MDNITSIRKTGQKATYLKGRFQLRDETKNWAHPIDFPTVFTAYGAAIKNGNWQSCTNINTPEYVIREYFENDRNKGGLSEMWDYCEQLSKLTWEDVRNDKDAVLKFVNLANNELLKTESLY